MSNYVCGSKLDIHNLYHSSCFAAFMFVTTETTSEKCCKLRDEQRLFLFRVKSWLAQKAVK